MGKIILNGIPYTAGKVNDIEVNNASIVDQDGIAELSTVAVSGDYDDLTNKPTIPGDTKVTQENTTESKDYRVLLSGTNDDGTKTEGAHKSTNLKFNPNVGDLQTLKLNGVTIGNNPVFTDQYVTQTEISTNADYEVLLSGTAGNTTRTEGANKAAGLSFNPSTGNLKATQLNGTNINDIVKLKVGTYSGTTNSYGNLSIADYAGKNVFGATVANAGTYVAPGSNSTSNPMLCFRNTNTNAALASTVVSGYVFYSD